MPRDSIDQHGIYRPLKKFARKMKRFPTPAEDGFWKFLVDQCGVNKVLRQRTFGWYILDFVVIHKLAVIELDGSSHDGRTAHDSRRDAWIKRNGLSVLRFDNSIAINSPHEILRVVNELSDHTFSEWTAIFKASKDVHDTEKRAALLSKGECFDRRGRIAKVAGLDRKDMSDRMLSTLPPPPSAPPGRKRPRCACGRGLARTWMFCRGCGAAIPKDP